jgi:uncharacterized protein with HEPN domain
MAPGILLSDILESIQRIRGYIGDGGEAGFLESRKTQAAVLWELIAIGEAARKLPDTFRNRFPAVPWKQLIGTRDFLAHGYSVFPVVNLPAKKTTPIFPPSAFSALSAVNSPLPLALDKR